MITITPIPAPADLGVFALPLLIAAGILAALGFIIAVVIAILKWINDHPIE